MHTERRKYAALGSLVIGASLVLVIYNFQSSPQQSATRQPVGRAGELAPGGQKKGNTTLPRTEKETGFAESAPRADAQEEFPIEAFRELLVKNPALLLEQAARAEEVAPSSPSSDERSWLVARALVDLGRFEEARKQALLMKRRYPDSSFTADAERHLLTHPLGLPAREDQQYD